MALEVVDTDQGATARIGEGLGVHDPREQRADQAGTGRYGDGVHRAPGHTGFGAGPLDHGRQRRHVSAAGQLRHHSPEHLMHVLRQDHEAGQLGRASRRPSHQDGGRGLVARGFDPQNDVSHGRRGVGR
jgi:hypothetical protein